MTDYDFNSDFSVDGAIESSKQGKLMGSVNAMPTASAEYEGISIQYTGATGGGYVNGHFYFCKNDSGTYKWVDNTAGGRDVQWEQLYSTGLTVAKITVGTDPAKDVMIPYATEDAGGIVTKSDKTAINTIPTIANDVEDLATALGEEIERAKAAEEVNANAIAAEVTRATGVESNKTDRSTTIANGKSLVTNLAGDAGACMKFEHTDGTDSAIAVNNGGASGVGAQLYCLKRGTPTEGVKLNIRKGGIYYLKNKATPSTEDALDEIVTKREIASFVTGTFKGRFAKKVNLPTTGVIKGDTAIVETDESKDNAATFYEFTTAWEYRFNIADDCVRLLGKEPGSGEEYHIPFNINALVQAPTKISTSFDTITLDNKRTKKTYPIEIPAADVANDKAGLFTKSLYDGIYTDINKRVIGEITSGTGKAMVFNEADGGGSKFEFTTGSKSFVGVNNDESDIMAQMYALDAANKGVRINITKGKAYYTKGQTGPTVTDNDEIATLGQVNGKVDKVTENGDFKTTYGGDETNVEIKSDAKFSPTHTGESTLMVSSIAGTYLTNKQTQSGTTNQSNLLVMPTKAYYFHDSIAVAPSAEREIATIGDVDKKVDRSVKDDYNATNIIDNQKGQEGCVMQSHLDDDAKTIVSFNTNTADGPNGILAQIYAKDTTGAQTGYGMRMNFYKDWVYLGYGTSLAKDDDNKIAVKGDLKNISVGTFRGNFASKAALLAYSGTKEKNDYAVVTADETTTPQFKTTRYRYSGTEWVFEYVLENNDCIKLLGTEAVSGQPYRLMYYVYTTPAKDSIKVTAKTITLDNTFGPDGKKVVTDYDLIVPEAVVTATTEKPDGVAGLYSKALADAKQDALTAITSDEIDALAWS